MQPGPLPLSPFGFKGYRGDLVPLNLPVFVMAFSARDAVIAGPKVCSSRLILYGPPELSGLPHEQIAKGTEEACAVLPATSS